MGRDNEPFSKVPQWLTAKLCEVGATKTEIVVLLRLMQNNHAGLPLGAYVIKGHTCYTSASQIAEDLGLTVKAVSKALNGLAKRGVLGKTGNGHNGQVATYVLAGQKAGRSPSLRTNNKRPRESRSSDSGTYSQQDDEQTEKRSRSHNSGTFRSSSSGTYNEKAQESRSSDSGTHKESSLKKPPQKDATRDVEVTSLDDGQTGTPTTNTPIDTTKPDGTGDTDWNPAIGFLNATQRQGDRP